MALHGHFHYPDLVPEFVDALRANALRADLFLTTDDPDSARTIEAATRDYDRGSVTIRQVPNRGRDIGPFLTEFGPASEGYDIVGHVHGKRSVHLSGGAEGYGDRWRRFLWQHLVGPDHPMADAVVERFAGDERLGLVLPEDPHLVGWDANRPIAEALARRLGMATPLPDFFTFPIGTMFWARREAVRPMFDLGLTWDDYPAEPLPGDGTILHALERLVPHVVSHTGFGMAATHVPGIHR